MAVLARVSLIVTGRDAEGNATAPETSEAHEGAENPSEHTLGLFDAGHAFVTACLALRDEGYRGDDDAHWCCHARLCHAHWLLIHWLLLHWLLLLHDSCVLI